MNDLEILQYTFELQGYIIVKNVLSQVSGELQSEMEMHAALKAKYGVDPIDIEAMIEVSAPRP